MVASIADAIDFELLVETLRKLKEGKSVDVPVYDFNTHCRAKYTVRAALDGTVLASFSFMTTHLQNTLSLS